MLLWSDIYANYNLLPCSKVRIHCMNRNVSVAVVGSGISGLALSIALRQKGFMNISVYEKDGSFESRRQGYGLTILQGKSALRSLGVL